MQKGTCSRSIWTLARCRLRRRVFREEAYKMSVEAPLQPERSKSAPLVPADGVAAGRGAGGSGAYVHTTHSNIFPKSPQVFEGTTLEGEWLERKYARDRVLSRVA